MITRRNKRRKGRGALFAYMRNRRGERGKRRRCVFHLHWMYEKKQEK